MNAFPTTLVLRRARVVLALGLLATACGGADQTVDAGQDDGGGDVAAATTTTTETSDGADFPELSAARATWEEIGLRNYTYTFTRVCECSVEDQGPFRVFVVDGQVDRVEWFGTEVDDPARTIPEMFSAVSETIAADLKVSVTFDELTGHPVQLYLDTDAMASDAGDGIDITSFSSTDLLSADLQSAKAQWDAAGITDYDFTYRVQCFCPETIRRVTVRDGEVVEVVDEAESFEGWPGLTIDDLFDELETAIEAPAFTIDVTYDEGYGFPSDYFIDEEQNMADEEHGIVVTEFKPLD